MSSLDAPQSRQRLLPWLVTLIAIAAVAAIVIARRPAPATRDGDTGTEASANAGSSDHSRPRASALQGPADRAGQPAGSASLQRESDSARSEHDQAVMNEWRSAIGRRDPDTVEALNRAFLDHPSDFTGALMSSAESDADERVRAFSTRVLGKLRAPATAELFRKLMADPSPYVRQNAAWGLGQLGDRNASPLLQRSAHGDPDPAVRESARDALRNIDHAGRR